MRTQTRRAKVAALVAAFVATTIGATTTAAVAPAFAGPADVRINEVESNGGTPGDWIELYNTGADPVVLDGYVVKDNDDTRTSTLPAGSVIAPGGYLVIEEATFGFGLGAADSARLFAPDGTTLIDGHSWTAHATTTYGRCPDGSGAFRTTTAVTKGAANDCSTVIRINEIESSGGTPGDWVELFNPGPAEADLTGWVFRDAAAAGYVLPSGSIVPVGGYLVLDEAAFGFGLGAADSATVARPDGTVADTYTWTTHAATTYGRCANGTGAFATTAADTKGAANSCVVTVSGVRINEVESNGGVPGDWVELYNTGSVAADLSGWLIKDNDDTRNVPLPAGSIVPAGGYLVVEEATFGFGLGAADSVRLYDLTGALYESYTWTAHAVTSYGRCPNGTGAFVTTTSVTKGAANDCSAPVRINEVESSGGIPGDWIELVNNGATAVDLSGFVVRDNNDAAGYTIPAGTTVAAGGYFVLDEATFGFGLGAADSARLFDPAGTLVDTYTWTAHAATTYGRCPNGSGAFTTTTAATKGTVNACPGDIIALPWPGGPDVQVADAANAFGGNLSGLAYESTGTPGVLWVARNGPGTIFRLVASGSSWVADTADGWSAGKLLRYPDGTGDPDAEGITLAGSSAAAGLYVATERNNAANGVSRNSILRFDPNAAGATLTATHEWNLTADLPVVGPNLGLEAVAFVPDAFLVAGGFRDQRTGAPYAPATYPGHGDGLFFVGLEGAGTIYAYALDHVGGGATRVATLTSPLAGVMDLAFDAQLGELWAVCDDGCLGRSALLKLDPATGTFGQSAIYDRPAGMANLNNEGFAFAPLSECVADRRPVFWADDGATGGNALRRGTIGCSAGPAPVIPEFPLSALAAALAAAVLVGTATIRRRRPLAS